MRCLGCGYALWNLKEPNCPECGRPYDLFDYRFVPGTVAFACPLCGHYHRGAGERYLPGYTDTSRCAGCGQMIATRQMNVVLLADDPDKAEAMPAEQVPWVERRVFGRRAVWWATFKMSITRPSEIGRRIGPHTRWQDAYWYAYVAHLIAYGIISAIVSMLAVVMMLWFGDGSMSEFGTLLLVLFGLVVVAPLVVPLFMAAVHGSVAHVFLIWTGPRRGTFRHTASSLFYTEGLQIFVPLLVVPCVAPAVPYSAPVISYATLMVQLALAVWSIVISAYILKHAQQVGGVRAAIAAMLGSILTYALILVVGFVG